MTTKDTKCFCCASDVNNHELFCYFAETDTNVSRGIILNSFIIGKIDNYIVYVPHALVIQCTVCFDEVLHHKVAIFQCGHTVCVDCINVMIRQQEICVICKTPIGSMLFLGQNGKGNNHEYNNIIKIQNTDFYIDISSGIVYALRRPDASFLTLHVDVKSILWFT